MKIYISILFFIVFGLNTFGQDLDSVAFKTELDELTIIGSIEPMKILLLPKKHLMLNTSKQIIEHRKFPCF